MGSKKKNKLAAGESSGTGGKSNGGKKLIDDPRFAKVHTDPRFQKVPRHKAKVSIDSRFSALFTDKRFAGSSAPLDKRGRPRKGSENALLRYYRQDGAAEELKKKKRREKAESDSEPESSSEASGDESEEEEEQGAVLRREKEERSETESSEAGSDESEGEGSDDSWQSGGVSVSDTDTDTGTDDEGGVDAEMWADEDDVEVENVPVIDEETHRLAVVNMDWNQVKAVDLYVMLSSCLPKEGSRGAIKSVAVYPSEFGLQRMQEEAVRGPVALFDDEERDDDDDDDDDEIDNEKLRAYEKSRLRYYYAVVECDSVSTADFLYKTCDGLEFERSSNVLDLRFIPDSMEFKHPPRDVATEAPASYEGLDFHTWALQHSDPRLSWDDDEPHRKRVLRRTYDEKELAELELEEFLASDEGESEEDENKDGDEGEPSDKKKKKQDMYRALLQSGDGSEEEDNEDQNMEVTFNTGLEDISKKILEKKAQGSETVWEAYLRKRKEKKKARRNRSKNSSDDDSDESDQEPPEQPDDFFEEEPSVERSKKSGQGKKKAEKHRNVEDKEAEASRAELELLLADDTGADNNLKGYKIKQKKAKGKKGKEAPDEGKLPTVDIDDPRFSALFTNPGFALDPTDPQFKRSATYFRQLAQKQRKGREEHAEKESAEPPRETTSNDTSKTEENHASRKEKYELSSMVRSLKMKSQKLSVPADVKKRKDKMGWDGSEVKEKKHKLPALDQPKKKKARV